MLSNAIVYATLPAVDIKRAKQFYEEKLGLKVVMEDPSPGIMFQVGDGFIYLYQRSMTKADHTVAAFMVDNIENEVRDLKANGVKFEEYDLPIVHIKTVNSIANREGMKSAWFKDTEGNLLALGQSMKVSPKPASASEPSASAAR